MFRKEDFKKVDLLGSGKKNTKIYKVIHRNSGKFYALKEVEAKSLDKLNEYKEEAVQLFKAQNHPNVIQFYGYFFYETMYNTFRIGIVCEYIEHKLNLEYVFRKRKQMNLFWKQAEMEKMMMSLVSTLSHMQSVGLCHRDQKPANLFLLNNGQIKVIDFGESKDLFKPEEDGGNATTATIRGTPQYLSPILWKAHVVDGNSRFAKHNIYKSDIFSVGLLFYQLAVMEDVTGFNQKTTEYDGEQLVTAGINKLRNKYPEHICHILNLMLKFYEKDRPSCVEMHKIMLQYPEYSQYESENQAFKPMQDSNSSALQVQSRPMRAVSPQDPTSIGKSSHYMTENMTQNNQSQNNFQNPMNQGGPQAASPQRQLSPEMQPSNMNAQIPYQNQMQHGHEPNGAEQQNANMGHPQNQQIHRKPSNISNNFGVPPNLTSSSAKSQAGADFIDEEEEEEAQNNIVTQAELFKSYSEQNSLYVNQCINIFWFEYGGKKIGRLNLDIIRINQMKMKAQHQNDSECSDPEVAATKAGKHYMWKLIGKYKDEFSPHQSIVLNTDNECVYILGGNGNKNSNLRYDYKTIKTLAGMPQEKTFFSTVYLDGIIYTFGGYDAYDKAQLRSCEYYNIKKDEWYNSEILSPNGKVEYQLHTERSQSSACVFDNDTIFIFGGYQKEEGSLDVIERFHIQSKTMELMKLKIPTPLRRFQSMKISTKKILLIGGVTALGKNVDSVFCFDLEKDYTIEQLDKIDKPGVIDYPVILDQIGNLHLLLEKNNGTSPPEHVIYSFLEYS